MRSQWEAHNGRPYFFADYARMSSEVFAQEAQAAVEAVLKSPTRPVNMLINVEGLLIGPRELDAFKQIAIKLKPVAGKSAVLGVSGAKKVMLDMVIAFSGMTLKAFEQREAALQWLSE
jgi:hypothetical protein